MPRYPLSLEQSQTLSSYGSSLRGRCSLRRPTTRWLLLGLLVLVALVLIGVLIYESALGNICLFWSLLNMTCKGLDACSTPEYSDDSKPSLPPGPQPLYGVCYSSWRTFGQCASADEIKEDIQVLKRFSSRVRLYGTGCPVEMDLLLEEATVNENFHLFLGVWLDGHDKADQAQIDDLIRALDKHPNSRISAIAVGNEVLLRGSMSKEKLVERIREVRIAVRRLGKKHKSEVLLNVPITTVETVLHAKQDIAKELDIVAVNIHPFFGRPNLADSKRFADEVLADFLGVYDCVKETAEKLGKKVLVSEVGWPTSSERGERNKGGADLAKQFINLFISYAKENEIEYFWFEVFDSVWKRSQFAGKSNGFSEFNLGLVEENHKDNKHLLDFEDNW